MQPVGLIVGHGYVKAVSIDRSVVFPALAAPAPASDYVSTVSGANTVHPVRVNGAGDWLVGEEAQTFAPRRISSILDRSRYAHPSYRVLVRAALDRLLPDRGRHLLIRTGMPASWYPDLAARGALEDAILQAAAPWGAVTVKIAPEAAGVFYAWVIESGGVNVARTHGKIGIIDIGYRDFNIASFVDARYVGGISQPGGMFQALHDMQRLISRQYQLELSPHEIDSALRRGYVLVDGTARALPAGTQEALDRTLAPILSAGRTLWPSGGRDLAALVLGGGGAQMVAASLAAVFPQLAQPACPSPQLAGAWGFKQAAMQELRPNRTARG